MMRISNKTLYAAFVFVLFAGPPTVVAQDPCAEKARADAYTKYYELKNKKDAAGQPDPAAQRQAYDIAMEYLPKYSKCDDAYTKAVQKFVELYGVAAKDFDFLKAFNEKRWADAVNQGKQIIAQRPDDTKITMLTAWAAYTGGVPPGDKALLAEAEVLIPKALQLLETGKPPDSYEPFKDKEDAQSYLGYVLGALNADKNPEEALKHLTKVAQSNGRAKTEPTTYQYLGYVYDQQYEKLAEQYKTVATKDPAKGTELLNNINSVVDKIIDAYARAIAYSKTESPTKTAWMDKVRELYKWRHQGSETGMTEMIASITTKPLPQ
jgi:tetratricopeptide (TPR) repeat protein